MVPDAYAASDLGWGVEEISKAREALVQSGLIHFDNATDELFIDQWFEHNPPTNEKHAKGVRNRIGEIYSDTIRERVEVSFEESDVKRIAKAEQKKREYELTKAKRQLGQNSNVTSLADTDFIRGFGAR